MDVTPKIEWMSVFLRAEHNTRDIISLDGVSRSVVNTVKIYWMRVHYFTSGSAPKKMYCWDLI